MQAAVDQVGDAVVITDAAERPGPYVIYTNEAFEQMTGYRFDEVKGRSPRLLQGPLTDAATLDELRLRLRAGEPFSGEIINYRKSGEPYVLDWHLYPLRDRDKRLTHWVAIQRDVTERNRALETARQHREELAHVTRLSTMGEMAAGLAHELNQPLAAIQNYLGGTLKRVEKQSIDGEGLGRALRQAIGQADRAGQMVRRLRDYVAKRPVVREVVALPDLLAETLGILGPGLRQQQVVVVPDWPDGLPAVRVDRIQIEQVLLNLIRNAAEARPWPPTPSRTGRLRSTLNRTGVGCGSG